MTDRRKQGNSESRNDTEPDTLREPLPTSDILPALYRAVIEETTDAVYCKRITGEILLWNRSAERLYGYASDEMIGTHVSELVPPDRIQELADILARLRLGERVEHFQTERIRKDGTRIEVDVTVSPIINSAGAIVAASSIARDITSEAALKHQIAESERRYRELVEGVSNIIVQLDSKGHIKYMNDYALKFFGYEDAEIVDQPADIIIAEEHRKTGLIKNIMTESDKFAIHENENVRKDGQKVTVLWTNQVVRDGLGRPLEVRSVGTDVTRLRQLEKQLKESERRFRLAVEHYPFPFGIYDADFRIEYANPAALRLLDVSADAIHGKTVEELRPEHIIEATQRLKSKALKSKEPQHGMVEFEWNDKTHYYEVSYVPVIDDQGDLYQILGISRDLTPLKLAEMELREAHDRLEDEVADRTQELEQRNVVMQDILDRIAIERVAIRDRSIFAIQEQLQPLISDFNTNGTRQYQRPLVAIQRELEEIVRVVDELDSDHLRVSHGIDT